MVIEPLKREDDVEEDLVEVVCTLCEKFTTQAINYLADNKTQTEIIGLLHSTCSQMWTMKKKVRSYFLCPIAFSNRLFKKKKNSFFCVISGLSLLLKNGLQYGIYVKSKFYKF